MLSAPVLSCIGPLPRIIMRVKVGSVSTPLLSRVVVISSTPQRNPSVDLILFGGQL
jgi:hypothetical protein